MLSSIRVEEETIKNMDSAIKKYNKNNIINFTQTEFRKMSYELLSQLILQEQEIPIKLIKG